MQKRIHTLALCGLAVLASTMLASPAPSQSENVLILIADDLGIDQVRAYGYQDAQGNPLAPSTTNIDSLASEGILFRNAWAAPACTTSRGEALTGRYANRLGTGAALGSSGSGDTGLRDDISTIADLLPPEYHRVILGKWHVAGTGPLGALTQGIDHAPRCGFEVHNGTFANFDGNQTYLNWTLLQALATNPITATETAITDTYATTYTTDIALRTIAALGDDPWFLWVAYHAPHKPYHIPPAHLIQTPGLDTSQNYGKGRAMIEALDTEIGRLLAGIPPGVRARTTVVFYGDNGTQSNLVRPPFLAGRSKGSIYNGGIHVPMIVSSPLTPPAQRGSESDALVDITDILPTTLEICGSPPVPRTDGVSMVPYLSDPTLPSQRDWIYAERFKPNFVPMPGETIADAALTLYRQTVRDSRYKLLRKWTTGGSESFEMYDLEVDFFELQDLLDAQGNPPAALQGVFDTLKQVIRRMAN